MVFGGVVLAIAIAVGLAEAAGWPFLVGPAQRWVGAKLDRRILVSGDAQEEGRVRIGLLGSVRLQAPLLEIGAPAWSDEPYMVRANNAVLVLAYGDLWRAWRGEPLRIRTLRSDALDARIDRLADGRASWRFGPATAPDPEHVARLPSFGELRVGDGKVLFRDAILEADLDAHFSLTERQAVAGAPASAAAAASTVAASAAPGASASSPLGVRERVAASTPGPAASGSAATGAGASGLELHATGKYRRLPLKVDLTTSGVLDVAGPDGDKLSQPVKLQVTIGRARLRFEGVAGDALHLTRLKGRFDVAGPSLAAVGDPLGVTLPTTGPFKTRGTLEKQGDVWKADFDEAAIGESRLDGSFTFDRRPAKPLLAGRLGGSRLVLADLGPVVGGPAPAAAAPAAKGNAGRGRLLPDREFDLPSLRAMDADVAVDIGYLDLGTALLEPLKPLRAHLRLQDGVLTLGDVDARTAEGRLSGMLRLDGRTQKALWTAELQLVGVRLERWLRQGRKNDAPPYVSGLMDGQVKVAGAGRSSAEILGSLDGAMRFHIRNGRVSHLAVEAAGLDPAQALGVLFKGDDALAIHCNVADMGVQKGLATPRMFVIDTDDSTIWVTGSLSLQNEALDLTAVVSPKDFSPLALRTPIHVKGTFSNPVVSIDKGRLGAKVGAAALLSLLNPLAALIPFIDPGASEDAKKAAAQCAALAKRSNLAKVGPVGPAIGAAKTGSKPASASKQ